MKLLGNYASNLTAFLYQELLNQLETSISKGDFAAGTLFDTTAAKNIQQQGQDFTNLTIPTAGTVASAEDLNNALDVLQARYTAITNEIADLQKNIVNLLAFIDKEATLIDQIIGEAEVEKWASQRPVLTTAHKFSWNFATGRGASDISPNYPIANTVDKASGLSWILNEDLSGGTGIIIEGLGAPETTREVQVKNLQWSFTPNSPDTIFEEIFADDKTWASLSTLEPAPLLTFGAPNIATLLPLGGTADHIFTASGSLFSGSLPIYVRILFHPRQVILPVVNATDGQTIQLSIYNVTANVTEVYDSTTVYVVGTDFSVDQHGVFTVLHSGALIGKSFNILFTEYFPAYQCSIDQSNWSPIVMLDPKRPYPDDTTNFLPIEIQGDKFPLTDELGVPLGIFIQMVGTPPGEMVLKVTTPGNLSYGETAQLTIDLERTSYINGLRVSPFTNFPVTITNIVAQGFTSDMQTTVLDIPVKLDRGTVIRFPRQLVSKFVVSFYQENYSLKEYFAQAPDSLRRDTLANLQSSLPFSVQRPQPSVPRQFEGALYALGIEDILALDISVSLPGLFVSGPYRVFGKPEVIRVDTQSINLSGPLTFAYITYDGNDNVLETAAVSIVSGTSKGFTFSHVPDHVDFYVQFPLSQELSVIEQFLLQVTTV